jgi:hypothetical protein
VAVGVAGGLAVYLSRVGLDRADKVSSAVSAVVGLIALTAALYGLPSGRHIGRFDAAQVHNDISGTVHGTVVQGSAINTLSIGAPAANDPHPPGDARSSGGC